MIVDWRTLPPSEVLGMYPSLNVSQVAYVLSECWTRKADPTQSRPVRRKAIDLIRAGALDLVDPAQPIHRWAVTSDEVRRYLASGPRHHAVAS